MVLHRLGFASARRAEADFRLELHAVTAFWCVRQTGARGHSGALHATAANQFSGKIVINYCFNRKKTVPAGGELVTLLLATAPR